MSPAPAPRRLPAPRLGRRVRPGALRSSRGSSTTTSPPGFTARPSEGTAAGLHQYDAALDDLSRPAVETRIAELKGQLARLGAIDRATLSADDAIDARVLDGQIRAELLDLETLRVWESNPMGYVRLPGGAIDGLIKRDFAPAAERLRSVIARERAVPAVFAAARANLKNPPEGVHRPGDPDGQGVGRVLPGLGRRVGARTRPAATPPCSRSSTAANAGHRRGRGVRRVARVGPQAAVEGPLRHRRRELPGEAPVRGDGRLPPARAARQGRGPAREGLRGVRRHGPPDRPEQDARRGDEGPLRRPPDGRRPDPLGPPLGRGGAAVPGREGDRDDPLGGPPQDRGDAALRPVGQLRVDGHPGSLRDEGDRGVLLRHARREGLGPASTPRSTCGSTTRPWSR